MKALRAAPLAHAFEPEAQTFVRRRRVEERLAQRAKVEARAPDEQRRAPARLYLFNRSQRVARPIGGRVAYFGRDEINQVMRHAAPLVEGDFGSGYLDLAVDLYGVAVDYLAARTQRER
jgi:hypothetical protein